MRTAVTAAPDSGALLLAALSAQQRQQRVALVQTVVRAWWQALETGLDLAPPPPPRGPVTLDAAVAAAARTYGQDLAVLPVAVAADRIGALHAGLMPGEERARHGVYYTPPALAERLVELADQGGVDWTTARVLDPAAGCGAFLVPLALRMAAAARNVEPALAVRSIATRLRGLELDPVAAWISCVMVEAALLPLLRGTGQRLSPCRPADALTVTEVAAADLVIGNPPYGRLTLAPDIRARFARSLYGHANLYGLFMDLAVRFTAPGGLIAFLTPSSFLAGDYFKHLRRTLTDLAPPLSLDFVDERKGVFDNVLQETVLATYRRTGGRKRRPARALVNMIRAGGDGGLIVVPSGSFTLPAEPTAPWILPRHASETGLATRLRSLDSRLADWGYRVATGPLVWNRHKPQISDRAGKGAVPLVWAECVTSDGRFTYRCEKANHKPWFHPAGRGDDWLLTRRPCVLLQRTTAKEQARRLIAAEMPDSFLARHPRGVTVENHLNMLLPLSDQPPAISPAVLAAFLNSRAADRAFRCISGSVAVSAYELEALPLPHPAALTELASLVAASASRERLDQAADRLYGIGG